MASSKIPLPQLVEIAWTYHPLFVTTGENEDEQRDEEGDSNPGEPLGDSDSRSDTT